MLEPLDEFGLVAAHINVLIILKLHLDFLLHSVEVLGILVVLDLLQHELVAQRVQPSLQRNVLCVEVLRLEE